MPYGATIQSQRRFWTAQLGQLTANSTASPVWRFGCPVGVPGVRILGIHVCSSTVGADADGDMLFNAIVNDVSEGADDTVVSSEDLEALVLAANQWYECTLAADGTEKILTLEAGDSLRFTMVSDSAAIDTNPFVQVMVEYALVPDYDSVMSARVPHRSEWAV